MQDLHLALGLGHHDAAGTAQLDVAVELAARRFHSVSASMKNGSVRANSATHASLLLGVAERRELQMQVAGVRARRSGADVAGVDHGDLHAEAREKVRGAAAVDAGADDDDVGVLWHYGDDPDADRLDRRARRKREALVARRTLRQHRGDERLAVASLAATHAGARAALDRAERRRALPRSRRSIVAPRHALAAAHDRVALRELDAQRRRREQLPQRALKRADAARAVACCRALARDRRRQRKPSDARPRSR